MYLRDLVMEELSRCLINKEKKLCVCYGCDKVSTLCVRHNVPTT